MIVGIDFGTSSSRVAALIGGKPVILENDDGSGTLPSAVSFRGDGQIVVGATAKRDASRFPEQVVIAAKRLIGRKYDDEPIQFLHSTLSVQIVREEDGSPAIAIHGKLHSPQEICSQLFGGLRKTATRRLGVEVRQAVVAVPAHYGDTERGAIRAAAAGAGLEIVRMVSEPTSAALFHGLTYENSRTIAVYDLGGGTFDFSVLEIGDGVFEVFATGGDTFLGGEDIDFRIQSAILERHALRAEELTPSARRRLKSACEEAKIELSAQETVSVRLDQVDLLDGRKVDLSYHLTQESLQGLCQDFIDRTLAICRKTIKDVRGTALFRAKFSIEDIDQVVLVGGSTRLPFIEEAVGRLFAKTPTASPRREDAVALGCAVQAGVLNGDIRDVLLLDVLPHSLGVRFRGRTVVMLDRHETIPCRREFSWSEQHDQPQQMEFEAFEGAADEGEPIRILGHATLTEMAVKNGWISANIELGVDANGRIVLKLRDEKGGGTVEEVLGGTLPEQRALELPSMADIDTRIAQPANPDYWPAEIPSDVNALRILAVATEWRSGAGGLSSFNRSLCQALSMAGHDVRCLVFEPEPYDRQLAKKAGVELVEVSRKLGFNDQLALARKPKLPDGWIPDIIIGHGRVTGPAAAALAEDHFPTARRLHVIHMAPDEIEWFKPDRADDAGTRAAERTRIECDLARSASFTAAVGPRLHDRFLNELAPFSTALLQIDPGFDDDDVTPMGPPPGSPLKILVAGRAEDFELKGLDIAASAYGAVEERWTDQRELELVVRGAPEGQAETLRTRLLSFAGRTKANIVVRPYNRENDQLNADFRRASVVLMPSRKEGFGLVGLEAIVAGIPLIVSSESGLAMLLKQSLPSKDWKRMVVPVQNDSRADRENWAAATISILGDREAAFQHAAMVREAMATQCNWEKATRALVTALG